MAIHRIKYQQDFLLAAGMIISFCSFTLYRGVDPYSNWLSFILYLVGFLLLTIALSKDRSSANNESEEQVKLFSDWMTPALVFVSIVALLYQIDSYPFALLEDAIRDGGWDIQRLLSGEASDPLGWGRYQSHGMIIPALSIPSYLVFGNSMLSFRSMNVLLCGATLLFVYQFARTHFNRQAAIFAVLALLANPYFLYFSRGETVVCWSFLLSILLLLVFSRELKSQSRMRGLVLALLVGFASGFHASVRIFAILILSFYLLIEITRVFRGMERLRLSLRRLLLIGLFTLLGFGPRIMILELDKFVKSDRYIYGESLKRFSWVEEPDCGVGCRYLRTWEAVFYSRISRLSQSQLRDSLITNPFAKSTLIYGMGLLLVGARLPANALLLFLLLVLPLTNSALTNLLCSDHRMAPLFTTFALVIGVGCSQILTHVRKLDFDLSWRIISLVFACIFLVSIRGFFVDRLADVKQNVEAYYLMHAIPLIERYGEEREEKSLCLHASGELSKFISKTFVKEALQYFLPMLRIDVAGNPLKDFDGRSLVIARDCHQPRNPKIIESIICNPSQGYRSPPIEKGSMRVFFDSSEESGR